MDKSTFKKLKKRVPVNTGAIIFACVLVGLGTLTSFAIPWFAKLILDGNNSKQYLMTLTCAVLFSAVVSVIGRYIFNKSAIVWTLKLRSDIADHIFGVKMKFFNKKNSSELSSEILNFTEKIKELFTSTTMHLISIAISSISIAVLFVLSWKLTLVMMGSLLAFVIVISPISSMSSKVYKKNQEALNKLIGALSSIFLEIKLVKSYTAEKTEAKRIGNLNTEVKNLSVKSVKIEAAIEPIIMTIFILNLFFIFVYGGSLVAKNEMTIGSLIAFCLYLFQIITPMVNIGNFFKDIKSLNEMSDSIVKIFELETEESGTKPVDNAMQTSSIKFDNISFKYDDDAVILKDLSLEIEPKKTIAIVGPSGSGKSTLFSLLERFYNEYEGSISIGNTDINEFDLKDWRKKISYVQQISSTTEDSILNNITYGSDGPVPQELIEASLKKAGIYDYVNSLPEKLNTIVQEKGTNFSSGQLQRLMIARALIKQPDILLLDEVTASLDSENELLVKTTLDSIKSEKTIVIIAHRLSTVTSADKIVFLDGGKITGVGTHEELLKTHALYEKYVNNQLI
ncbi:MULTISPECIES: ABC transporter ATP-binding protein [unclassified Treponema]|uniref:ABC transporter ATP-binding protein n=1 Tax=unclassified Treponema TaxID=2638727 RepID=UPI0020A297BC|nr:MULTISPECIES: ABC transporter ATP-binding protein [unclassified Treponema]UTC67174.1 ABC transporter ATP-binding protein [Treponema sp. OMZ 789]UTC69904.1 ABC transporter ATP-binding protein [Treponema sp. OMZ 790]UTC72619.1 ABC transporter ATP-binding protein [Treponema sp. OMZ 791]